MSMFIDKYDNGAWREVELLGEGSFGKVYKIVKEELGHSYYAALKIIPVPKTNTEIQTLKNDGYNDASIRTYISELVEYIMKEVRIIREFKGISNIVSYEGHLIQQIEGERGACLKQ
ncbi:MAG: hypothetical protein LBC41_12095 [Clostridiales bacterium]|jgi:serine/threonine protein kinase|nr:hypothetical protein [Clostridiales bacterium]MDR2751393.1 hypothetical protein [Clostridiales bacterium]